jgi:hypothetical protein
VLLQWKIVTVLRPNQLPVQLVTPMLALIITGGLPNIRHVPNHVVVVSRLDRLIVMI